MSKFVNAVVLGLVSFILILAVFWYVVEIREESQVAVTNVGVAWGSTTSRATELTIQLNVRNPHKSPVLMREVTYEIIVNGNRLDEGVLNETWRVEPESEAKKSFTVTVPSRFVVDWIDSHLEGSERSRMQVRGETLFAISNVQTLAPYNWESSWEDLYVRALSDALHNCSLQASTNPPLPPCIESTEAAWDTAGTQSVLRTSFQVHNPNSHPIRIKSWSTELLWQNVTVARGGNPAAFEVPASSNVEIVAPVVFERLQMPVWWPAHVQKCEKSTSNVLIKFVVEDSDGSGGGLSTSFEWFFAAPPFATHFVCEPA